MKPYRVVIEDHEDLLRTLKVWAKNPWEAERLAYQHVASLFTVTVAEDADELEDNEFDTTLYRDVADLTREEGTIYANYRLQTNRLADDALLSGPPVAPALAAYHQAREEFRIWAESVGLNPEEI